MIKTLWARIGDYRRETAVAPLLTVAEAVLETMKDITLVEPTVTIRGALKDSDLPNLEALADAILA